MLDVQKLSLVGGTFAVLVLWHFFADVALKAVNAKNVVTARHSKPWRVWDGLAYVFVFSCLFIAIGFSGTKEVAVLAFMFASHFIIDSGALTIAWMKHVMKVPAFNERVPVSLKRKGWSDTGIETRLPTDEEAFESIVHTPVGFVTVMFVDQLFHVACLVPVAWMVGP